MDVIRFDRLTRRYVLGGLTAALGLGAGRLPDPAAGKRKKRKKVKFNAFGCVNVGGFCKTDTQCCSGICRGKKGEQKCRNHDAGTGCRAGINEDVCGGDADIPCTTATGFNNGVCDTTTGNAPYCVHGFVCAECSKDEDCREFCELESAACIKCPDCKGTAFQTACVGPSQGDCI